MHMQNEFYICIHLAYSLYRAQQVLVFDDESLPPLEANNEVQMEFDTITKFIFGLVSTLGTFAVIFLSSHQAAQAKAELLAKFENALKKEQKHSATELFRLLHGLRMNYSDIVELVQHDDCIKIIYAIKKTPGLVRYEQGNFKYTKIAKNPIFKFIDLWIARVGIAVFGLLTAASLLMLSLGDGGTALAGFIFMLFGASMLGIQIRQSRHDQMVANIIQYDKNNVTSHSETPNTETKEYQQP